MKHKLITIIGTFTFILTSFFVSHVFAASPSPTTGDSAATSAELQKMQDLIASQVAKMDFVSKVGILGTVQDSSNTDLDLVDDSGNATGVDIDELTQFSDSANTNFGVSDIKKGNVISVIGLYNKSTKRLLARVVTQMHSLPVFFEGVITDKDTKNYTYTAVDENGKSIILNVDVSTKIQSYSSADGQIKAGFSKAEIGERVFAAGFTDLKNPGILNVSRTIYFTDLPPSTGMKNHAPNLPASAATPTVVSQ